MGSAQGAARAQETRVLRRESPAGERAQLVVRVGWAEGPRSAALIEPPGLSAEPREEARSGRALPAELQAVSRLQDAQEEADAHPAKPGPRWLGG